MDKAFAAERAAWAVVNRRLPGQHGHDAKAWGAWVNAARTANQLADGLRQSPADAPQRINSGLVVGIVIDDQSAISLGTGLQQVAEHYDAALQDLVTQAQSGDVEAFEAFYIATAHWLLPRVRLLVTGEDFVEDALVGTYLRAWADIKTFNAPNVKPQEWLLSVATKVIGKARSVAAPIGVTPVSQVPAISTPVLDSATVVARQLADADQQLVVLVHDIRTALASAVQALNALYLERLPVDGATGEALKRSLTDIEKLLAHALEEGRARPNALEGECSVSVGRFEPSFHQT